MLNNHSTEQMKLKSKKKDKKSEKSLEERKQEILSKLVRPMGNPAELEKILVQ